MQKTCLRYLVALLLIAGSTFAYAGGVADFFDDFQQARVDGKLEHVLDIDNDSLLLNNRDGFYTSGLQYTQAHRLRGDGQLTIYAWRIGQQQYTASDIKLKPEQIPLSDHPYAAWLYGGVAKAVHRADGTHARWGVDLGCLGPCAGGEATQTALHRLIQQPLPQGWSTQLRNEFGVVLYGDLAPIRWSLGQHIDITPSLSGRFGNIFTNADVDMIVRAGRLNLLPDAPTFHLFLRTKISAVAYNAALQGGYFSHNNPRTVDPKPMVGEGELGIVWRNGGYSITASVVRRSNEIHALPNSVGAQSYAHLQFSYTPQD